MKVEISWKRRLRRKRLKYMLLLLFIVGVTFVMHQLLYLKELNKAIVGKLITGSVQASHYIATGKQQSKWNKPEHLKLIRNKDGQTVSLRGTRDQDISKYLPNAHGKFVCFASGEEVDFAKINDDYCDCPLDGSDEPGTNACNNGFFYCEVRSFKFTERIASYKVNDGVCDCCDGSDEWGNIALPHVLDDTTGIQYRKIQCPNKCS